MPNEVRAMSRTQQTDREDAAPDYRLHCPRCCGAFLEMATLLFHACGQPAKPKRTRQKPKKRARVSRG